MNKFLILTSSSVLLLGALLITGCGGGGGGDNGGTSGITYDGNTSPAAIDATNAEAIGTAAGESIQIADASTGLADLPVAIAISSPANMDQINNIVISAVNTLNLPTGVDVPGICNSGSVTASDNEPEASGEWNITITFNNCVVTEQNFSMTLNGTAVWHVDDINDLNTGFYITYKNFTVTDNINGGTTTINMTFACTDLENTLSCTYNSDFVGSDGVTHRVSDYTITGSADIGFSGSATFFHGTYGQVTITISGITYGGCGAIPDGGTLEFYSSDESFGVITFHDDCTVSGSWNNSGGSGSF